jgi:hypothetical protein
MKWFTTHAIPHFGGLGKQAGDRQEKVKLAASLWEIGIRETLLISGEDRKLDLQMSNKSS